MQHVLDDGYRAIVEVTGAQYQRVAPIAMEGWRPRFVEQSLSVNLKWAGKDGKPHEYRNVPVTEAFADSIVSGNQIRLAILPAKVLDDELAVPVINADAAARFASLQEWIRGAAYVAVVSWLAFIAMSIWLSRTGQAVAAMKAGGGGTARDLPIRTTLLGITALVVGAILAVHGWTLEDAVSEKTEGIETTAEIALGTGTTGSGTHAVRLSWKDPQGGVHHFGPVPVSEGFWNKITKDGQLTVPQTRIRYQGDGMDARPVIVGDNPTTSWQTKVALAAGLLLMVIGAGCLLVAARALRSGK